MAQQAPGDGTARRAAVRRRTRELLTESHAQVSALTLQVSGLTRGMGETARRGTVVGAPGGGQAQLAAIVRASDDAILSMAPDTTVLTWNAGAEHLLGYTAEQMIGRSVRTLVPEDEAASFESGLARIHRGEHALTYDTWRLRSDGSRVEVSVSVSGMWEPDGTLGGYCSVLRDLTPRRETEAALAAIEAERRVQEDHERIARNLHDLVIQRIFSAGLSAQAAANIAEPELRDRLMRVVEDLDLAITELRTAIFGLRRAQDP